jgi:hypothetical protein
MIDPSLYKVYYLSGVSTKKLIELNGINNLSINENISFEPSVLLGGLAASSSINSPKQIELTFDRTYTEKDPLINYTGNNFIEKLFVYNGSQYYEISNPYLRNYSAGFSVGDLPKISTSFTSIGEDVVLSNTAPNLEIIKLNSEFSAIKLCSIFISGINQQNSFKENFNIFSFDYSINLNRQPYYTVGNCRPIEVNLILPLEISVSINSKLPNNSINHEMVQDKYSKFTNFDIIVSGQYSMFSLPFRNGKLINTSVQLASQNTIEIKNNYLGYYGL